MSYDLESVRRQFPILQRQTYLASHSLGAVPRKTREALGEYWEAWASQGIQAWDGPWWESVETFSALLRQLLNAEEDSVVPMQNATRAIAGVLSCFDWASERNRIVMTDLEFTTTFPLIRHLKDLGAEIVIIESEEGRRVAPSRFAQAIDQETRLVLTSHVYFRSGAIQDLAEITKMAHEAGAYVLGDGYQAVGTIPVDLQELGVDFYVGGSHKWLCGGPGAGFLYVRPQVAGRVRPGLTGWFGLEDPFAYDTDPSAGKPAPAAKRFLGGTPNIPALYAAREGIKTVLELGVDQIREHSLELGQAFQDHLDDRGWKLTGPEDPKDRSGMVCFSPGGGGEWKAKRLAEQGVMVDARPDAGMRAGLHFYNNEEEIATLFEALAEL